MAEEQDKGYRLLFSFPRMVEDLIRLFVGGDWLERLDFTTLEKVSERDVSPELVRREKDLLWRLRMRPEAGATAGGDWFYLFLHLEFQSEPYRFMAVRVLTYRSLLWEDLIRQGALTASGKLPPVLSVVVYNGDTPWTSPTSVNELVEPLPVALEGSDLLSYRLVEERSYPAEDLDAEASPVAGLFLVERGSNLEEVAREAREISQGLRGSEHQQLREALGTYVAYRLRRLDSALELPQMIDLMEVPSMLEQRVAEWTEEWKRQGLQEGRREGRQEGRQEGRREGRQEGRQEGRREGGASLLLRLLERKFGTLAPPVRERVESADARQVLDWGERVLTAKSVEEVFRAPGDRT